MAMESKISGLSIEIAENKNQIAKLCLKVDSIYVRKMIHEVRGIFKTINGE